VQKLLKYCPIIGKTDVHLGLVPTHTHIDVWLRVERWTYWRPQLVVTEQLVTLRKPTAASRLQKVKFLLNGT